MSLTADQLRHLESRLQEERARALDSLNQSVLGHADATEQEQAGDVSAWPSHIADLGSDTERAELEAANATRISRELSEIDAALQRLRRDPERFGICEDIGKPIPFARLDLVPWARTCEAK